MDTLIDQFIQGQPENMRKEFKKRKKEAQKWNTERKYNFYFILFKLKGK